MKNKVRLFLSLASVALTACINQKSLGVTFTESGKGVGIFSGQVDKTATAAPATIGSLVNTLGAAVTILEFTVKENGSKDGYPLQIKELRFTNTGTADIADLRFVLEGPGSNNTISSTSGTTVTFKNFGDIIVTDGDTTGKTYQVKVHVRGNIQGNMTDNNTILLKTSPRTDFDVTETSSNFLESVTTFQQGSATSVDVVATELQGKGTLSFGTTGTAGVFPNQVTLSATDANGRVDKDYITNITLIARQTDCVSAQGGLSTTDGTLTHTPVQGVATWSNMTFGIVLTTFKVYATSGILTAQCSAAISTPNP